MLNFLDLCIVFLLLIQARRWANYGFVRGFMSVVAFWIGVLFAIIIAPKVVRLVSDAYMRVSVTVLLIVVIASVAGFIGKVIGGKLHIALHKIKLGQLNKITGVVFGFLSTLFVVWLLAAVLHNSPSVSLNTQIRNSSILRVLDNYLPSTSVALNKISETIINNNFPKVFIGPEPSEIEPTESTSSVDVQLALRVVGRSTVRIESYGCGGIKYGSGFVAAPNVVITNAHVVSGIDTPYVSDKNGQHQSEVILYDPDIDIAILRTSDLAGQPLILNDNVYNRGTKAVALGYPGGRNLQAVSASILQNVYAQGRNIYGSSIVSRPISILQTTVINGNSGGPVVISDGSVIGVIFARSESVANVGYSIRSSIVSTLLQKALSSNQTVSTLACSEL